MKHLFWLLTCLPLCLQASQPLTKKLKVDDSSETEEVPFTYTYSEQLLKNDKEWHRMPKGVRYIIAHHMMKEHGIVPYILKRLTVPSHVLKRTGLAHNPVFSPDGSCLITLSHDRALCLWNVATGELIKERYYFTLCPSVCFNKKGTQFLIYGAKDVYLYYSTGKGIGKLPHNHPVTWAAFDEKNERVVVCSAEEVIIWYGRESITRRVQADGMLLGVRRAHFTSDGRHLVVLAGSSFQVIHIVTNQVVYTHEGRFTSKPVCCQDRVLTCTNDHEVGLIEVPSGKRLITFRAAKDESVISTQLSSSGKTAYIKTSCLATVWNCDTGECLLSFDNNGMRCGHTFINDELLIEQHAQHVGVWDLSSGTHITTLKPYAFLESVQAHKDTCLAVGSNQGAVKFYDLISLHAMKDYLENKLTLWQAFLLTKVYELIELDRFGALAERKGQVLQDKKGMPIAYWGPVIDCVKHPHLRKAFYAFPVKVQRILRPYVRTSRIA